DTVPEFAEFDIDVRKEFIGDDALRLGGVGSFEDLAAQLFSPTVDTESGDLTEMGWDEPFDDIDILDSESIDIEILVDEISDLMPDFEGEISEISQIFGFDEMVIE
ncbi:MAG: hypothetical protein QF590_04595, partial [Dehalococcoidia bacterium]|nr:hypothetical protein [Dehalococcoidia bacterium]